MGARILHVVVGRSDEMFVELGFLAPVLGDLGGGLMHLGLGVSYKG